MVIGLLTIAAIPTTIGVAFGVNEQKKKNAAKNDETRMAKFYLDVFCDSTSRKAKEINGKRVVLRDDKIWIDESDPSQRAKPAHTIQAFYVQYPDDDREPTRGMVSTISDDPPLLNWIYVDKDTLELKYGNRTQSVQHLVGPWDWTEDEAGLTMEGWEGFVAVEEGPGEWALYFDQKDNKLKDVAAKKRVLQISLERTLVEQKKAE